MEGLPNGPQQTQQIGGAILPLELLVETLSYLTPKDGWLAAQVCRWWQQLLARDDRLRAQVLKNEECDSERWFYTNHRQPGRRARSAADWAAGHGYLALLQWLQDRGFAFSDATCASAAE